MQFLGDIGRDGSGLIVKRALDDIGVDTSLMRADKVRRPRSATLTAQARASRCIVLVDAATSDNAMVVASTPDVTPLRLPDLSGVDVMTVNNEISIAETRRALEAATEAGVLTIANPSPLPQPWSIFPHELVDWLIVNEHEYAIARASRKDVALGRIGTVITLGELGARAETRSGLIVECPLRISVQPRNTVGAGDCFLGYYATAIARLPRDLTADRLLAVLELATTPPRSAPSATARCRATHALTACSPALTMHRGSSSGCPGSVCHRISGNSS